MHIKKFLMPFCCSPILAIFCLQSCSSVRIPLVSISIQNAPNKISAKWGETIDDNNIFKLTKSPENAYIDKYTFFSPNLPLGVSISSVGQLTGTPIKKQDQSTDPIKSKIYASVDSGKILSEPVEIEWDISDAPITEIFLQKPTSFQNNVENEVPIKPQQFNCNYFPAYASFDKNKLSYSLFTSTGEQHLNIEPSSGILSGYFQCNEPTSLLTISVSYGIYTGSIILPINVSHSTSSSTIIQHEK